MQNPPDFVAVRRALLSVSDKTDIVPFATALAERGVELVSTGGTARALEAAGLTVRAIDDLTGFPEMMDGRLKTLHPRVHGGLLARRELESHRHAAEEHGIDPIDLVCVNLYPFTQTLASGAPPAEVIEQIDIGGPAMVRSAAKNHLWTAIVTSPAQYAGIQDELDQNDGHLSLQTRSTLAAEAFRTTALHIATMYYDGVIALASTATARFPSVTTVWPDELVQLELLANLRPHVIALGKRLQEWKHLEELGIALVVEPALDRDAVVQLEAECLRRVVDNRRRLQVATKHREVLEVVAVDEDA